MELDGSELGDMNISRDVLGALAGISASEVEGVAALSGGFAGDIAEIFGSEDPARGVNLKKDDEGIKVDINLVVSYDVFIPEVARQVQERVTKSLTEMAGADVIAVNVHILGINIPEGDEDCEEAGGDENFSR